MKYIVIKSDDGEVPIIFPDTLTHRTVAEALQKAPFLRLGETVSAGYIPNLHIAGVTGSSHTLDVKSREEDADLINQWGAA